MITSSSPSSGSSCPKTTSWPSVARSRRAESITPFRPRRRGGPLPTPGGATHRVLAPAAACMACAAAPEPRWAAFPSLLDPHASLPFSPRSARGSTPSPSSSKTTWCVPQPPQSPPRRPPRRAQPAPVASHLAFPHPIPWFPLSALRAPPTPRASQAVATAFLSPLDDPRARSRIPPRMSGSLTHLISIPPHTNALCSCSLENGRRRSRPLKALRARTRQSRAAAAATRRVIFHCRAVLFCFLLYRARRHSALRCCLGLVLSRRRFSGAAACCGLVCLAGACLGRGRRTQSRLASLRFGYPADRTSRLHSAAFSLLN